MPTKRFLYPLAALLLVGLALGVYKIAVFRCIAADSVLFLNFARDLAASPGPTIRSYDQHPGYPAMMMVSQRLIEAIHGPLTLDGRIAAGQSVTLLCRSLALCVLYLFFLQFARPGPAFVNALILLLIPAYAENGSDVLSDWPGLLLMAAAGWFCLAGIRRWQPGFFIGAGVATGLGYYIRPEAAIFLPILLIFVALRNRSAADCRKRMLASLALMAVAVAGITIPYMIFKGAVFPKKDIGRFSGAPVAGVVSQTPPTPETPARSAPALAAATLPSVLRAAACLGEEAANTLLLFLLPWAIILFYKLLHFRRLSDPDRFLSLFAVSWIFLMIWLYCRAGYISDRHLLPLIAFTFAWLYEGVVGMIQFLIRHPQRVRSGVLIVLAVGAVIFVPKLLRPVRSEKAVYRETGRWLNAHTQPEDRLCVFDPRIGFYAQRPWSPPKPRFTARCRYLVAKPGFSPVAGPILRQATLLKTGIARVDASIAIYRLPNPSRP